ncbi:DUF6122 family protein [Luteirhabdus pelagi]|uniref:DUF6122 family protein n=1 Tax=Luteirhabdus pelagi TaxID=2792783 RepID=UPI001F2BDE14|nr:DUF6122 family protein [Luteirhabdus pelagi]
MIQISIHYFLHFLFPLAIAYLFFKRDWKRAYLILLATMLIDLDHLLATPIFEAQRCSLNYHPLHSYYAAAFYSILLFLRKPFNIIGIGLLMHLATDLIDCLFTYHECQHCLKDSPALELIKYIST